MGQMLGLWPESDDLEMELITVPSSRGAAGRTGTTICSLCSPVAAVGLRGSKEGSVQVLGR